MPEKHTRADRFTWKDGDIKILPDKVEIPKLVTLTIERSVVEAVIKEQFVDNLQALFRPETLEKVEEFFSGGTVTPKVAETAQKINDIFSSGELPRTKQDIAVYLGQYYSGDPLTIGPGTTFQSYGPIVSSSSDKSVVADAAPPENSALIIIQVFVPKGTRCMSDGQLLMLPPNTTLSIVVPPFNDGKSATWFAIAQAIIDPKYR